MRNRSFRPSLLSSVAVAAGLALTLTSCTSEEPAPPASSETGGTQADGASATDDGLEGDVPDNGWYCEHLNMDVIDAAAGGTAVEPREKVVQDDEKGWACEVLVGEKGSQEPLLRLSIQLGEEARAEARARAEAVDGWEEGPQHLGRSYISPGLVTGLTSCTKPEATQRSDQTPHTLVAESFGETNEEVTEGLRAALSLAAQNLDRNMGCSPKQAAQDQAESTTAP